MIKKMGKPYLLKETIPPATYDSDEEWVQEYIDQFGEEPSFF